MRISLDGITTQYLIDSGAAEGQSLFARDFAPGGRRFTDMDAMRRAISDKLDLYLHDRTPYFGKTQISIMVSDSISAATLRSLLDTEIEYAGAIYAFDGISSGADIVSDYDGEHVTDWTEVYFCVVK